MSLVIPVLCVYGQSAEVEEIGVLLFLPVGVAVLLLFDSLFLAYCFRARKGRFEVVKDDQRAFVVLTDVGRVTIDREKALFSAGSAPPVPLAQLERLDYYVRSEWAGTEEWLMGVDLWDYWKRYQDQLHWHAVAVCPAGAARIPIFLMGEYEPREPLLNWSGFLEAQLRFIARLGWIEYPRPDALSVVDRLQLAFRESGVSLSLGSRAATERASSERRITMR